jgi:glycine/D-amino acid oxidase-like deaminating enzyme
LAKTAYGTAYWLDRFPASRRPSYPRYRGDLRTDVVVVGGGVLGCSIAYAFSAAGIDVVLLEQGRLAQHQAGHGSGIVVHEPEPDFHVLAAQHGIRAARHIYQTARRGSLEYVAALRRLGIECGLQLRHALHFGSTPEAIDHLQKEYRARQEAGVEVAALKGSALQRKAGVSGFALLTRDAASVDAYRATLGMAKAAVARGARVFEQSEATRVRPLRRGAQVRCNGGVITASKVVLATGYPTDDFKPLRRRFVRCETYVVLTPELPAAIRREMTPPDLILRDSAAPNHWVHWVGNRVLCAGADQTEVADRAKDRTLVQRTGQLMYELSVIRPAISGVVPEFSWDVPYSRTIDGVPYYGPHRNYPHHYFAFSGGAGGLGLSFAAARIILRDYQDAADKGDEPFSFTRIRE